MSLEHDLQIAALLREAGASVDEAAFWANRIRVAAYICNDRAMSESVVLALLAKAFIPEEKRQPLVDGVMEVMGR